MTEIPKAPIKRIAKENGVERISKDAEEKLVEKIELYTANLSKVLKGLSEHAGRKTINSEDVDLATRYPLILDQYKLNEMTKNDKIQ